MATLTRRTITYKRQPEPGKDAWYIVCDTPAITTRREVDRTVDVSVRVAEGDGYLGIQSGNPYAVVSLLPLPGTVGRISVGSGTRSDNNKMITFPVTYTAGDTDLDTALMVVVQRHETTTGDEQMRSQRIPFTTVARGSRRAIMRVVNWDEVGLGYDPASLTWDTYTFYPGDEGDVYEDFAIYRKTFYKCTSTYTKRYNIPITDNSVKSHFMAVDFYEVIATRVFFAERAKINNLFVDDIEIVSDNGVTYLRADKDGVTCRQGTFENVQIVSGKTDGPRLELTPGSDTAAGGIDIYDDNTNIVAARYSADRVTNPTGVFANTTNTFSIDSQQISVNSVDVSNYNQGKSVEWHKDMSFERDMTLPIGFSASLFLRSSTYSITEPDKNARCEVTVSFNGSVLLSQEVELAHWCDADNHTFVDITVPQRQCTTKIGSNRLSIVMTLHDYDMDGRNIINYGYAQLTIPSMTLTATAPTKMARYFANGIVIGTSASNYFATYIDGGETKHEMLAGSWGLQVSTAGIKFRDPAHGSWTKLKLTADN